MRDPEGSQNTAGSTGTLLLPLCNPKHSCDSIVPFLESLGIPRVLIIPFLESLGISSAGRSLNYSGFSISEHGTRDEILKINKLDEDGIRNSILEFID